MRKILFLLFCATTVTLVAQEKNPDSKPAFQRHEISLSAYGNFWERTDNFAYSDYPFFQFKQQVANGLQYKYHLTQKDLLRVNLNYFYKKEKGLPSTNSHFTTRGGIAIGYEHVFCTGKWRPYVFGECQYNRQFVKDVFDESSIILDFDSYVDSPQIVTQKYCTNQMGLALGGGLKYFCCSHFFVGIEASASMVYSYTRHTASFSSYINPYAPSKSRGNVITLSPVRFFSLGVSF